ncbi:hypothetical protein PC110_g14376 [Phytophthora cactorum]|uniref:Thaumatin n=2 Tax=Phytophthora cactorum TaxID=29920 RepID=A0A329RXQ3_9STRA|nr:hypothetical protein PC112_g12159 [Phytophthora cactorum]KAG2933187.1 hypothetical protein PC117_g12926 [Phytophthora cactorum]KAG3015810.1 hypothetical protein PC120_g11963 [Phytophthora cactorum]KAG4052789.1 hypothetical protein PC123_g12034 [Phytophthora cactorum]RAW29265.1 hypothetical protein PC110_g14376 [Phytophthora cactorum]
MARRAFPLIMLATAPVAATKIQAVNLCNGTMELHIGSHGDPITIAQGAGHSLELTDGSNAAYRYGASYQATQAEFANVDSSTWYDISIIPAGNTGPGSCSSLEDCKAVTQGTGFNVAMMIVPSSGGGTNSTETCRVLRCLHDGCDDAYQFPDQDARTHSCSAEVEFQVVFCADNAPETTSDSAEDYWVDSSSSTGSESNSNSTGGSSDTSSQSNSNSDVESQSKTTPEPSSDKEKTVSTGSEDSSGTPTVVYVAAGLAACVVALVAAAFVFKRRHAVAFWWETRNYKKHNPRSSDELGFVRVSDDVVI